MQSISYHRVKIYDPVLRLIHAWNALALLMLMVTAWTSALFEPGAHVQGLYFVSLHLGADQDDFSESKVRIPR